MQSMRGSQQAKYAEVVKERRRAFNEKWCEDEEFRNWLREMDNFTAECTIFHHSFSVKFERRHAPMCHSACQKHTDLDKQQRQTPHFSLRKIRLRRVSSTLPFTDWGDPERPARLLQRRKRNKWSYCCMHHGYAEQQRSGSGQCFCVCGR